MFSNANNSWENNLLGIDDLMDITNKLSQMFKAEYSSMSVSDMGVLTTDIHKAIAVMHIKVFRSKVGVVHTKDKLMLLQMTMWVVNIMNLQKSVTSCSIQWKQNMKILKTLRTFNGYVLIIHWQSQTLTGILPKLLLLLSEIELRSKHKGYYPEQVCSSRIDVIECSNILIQSRIWQINSYVDSLALSFPSLVPISGINFPAHLPSPLSQYAICPECYSNLMMASFQVWVWY